MTITQSYSTINVVPDGGGYANYTTNIIDTFWNDSIDTNSTNFTYSTYTCHLNLDRRNIAILTIMTTIFCLSVIGNFLVILTILQNRWMRTVTNFLLLNLAVSDLILTIICMPSTLTGYLFQCFFASLFMCRLVNYMQPVSVAACSFTLVVIAMERYKAICQPLHSRHWKTKSHALTMILIVWILAFLCSIPLAVATMLLQIKTGQYNCTVVWNYESLAIFYAFLTVALFIVPLTLMTILYSLVIKTLWKGMQQDVQFHRQMLCEIRPGHKQSPKDDLVSTRSSNLLRNIGYSVRDKSISSFNTLTGHKYTTTVIQAPTTNNVNSSTSASSAVNVKILKKAKKRKMETVDPLALRSTHSERSLLAKKRVIKMLAAIVIEFFVCWMPLFTLILYTAVKLAQKQLLAPNMKEIHASFLILAYISSCTNPVTYCFLNVKFRHALLITIGCRFMVKNSHQYSTTSVYNPSGVALPKRSTDERVNGAIDHTCKSYISKFGSNHRLASASRSPSGRSLNKLLPTTQSTDTFNSDKNFLSAPKSAYTEDSLLDEDRTTEDNTLNDDIHMEKVTTM